MLAEVDDLKRQFATRAASGDLSADALLAQAETVKGATVIVAAAPGANANLMRQLIDQIRKKTSTSAVFLATTEGDNKVVLVAGVSRDLVEKGISAGNWVRDVAPIVGGGGILTFDDALEFFLTGASAVTVGLANLIHPETLPRLATDLKAYLAARSLPDLSSLIGSAKA